MPRKTDYVVFIGANPIAIIEHTAAPDMPEAAIQMLQTLGIPLPHPAMSDQLSWRSRSRVAQWEWTHAGRFQDEHTAR